MLGADPSAHARDVRRGLGYMPDVLGVYDNLRVDEYLEFFAASYRIPRQQWPGLVDGLLELVDLDAKRTAMVNSLSRGMKQRLSLARTLVHDPELLVLDEPASGLDPRARVELRELLRQLNGMGKTIIISSHILAELEEVCTDVAIMEAGQLLAAGPPREILERLGGARDASRVRFADGTDETFPVADDDEQAALLRRLVVDERPRRRRVRRGARRPRAAVPVASPKASSNDGAAMRRRHVNPVLGRELTERLRGLRAFVALIDLRPAARRSRRSSSSRASQAERSRRLVRPGGTRAGSATRLRVGAC